MSPQQKQQYEDALGSIFDFIYSESQKPPSKVKPMKVTGVDGSSEMVEALTAVLENPLLFVNNSTMESFKEAIDIDMAKFSLGDRGGGVSFNLQDIGKIVSNPGEFIDKSFTKLEAIRKMQRAANAGEAMKSVLGGMWAKRNGLDWDTQKAMMAAGNMSESYTASGGKAGRSPGFSLDMMSRNEELMERHFTSGTRTLSKSELIKRYGKARGEQLFAKYGEAKTKYQNGNFEKDKGLYLFADKELYALLEGEEMRYKAQNATNRDEKLKYLAAGRFIDHMSANADLRKYKEESQKSIKWHLGEIEKLKKSSGSSADISEHRARIRDLRSNLNVARYYDLAGELGKYEGVWNTAKGLFNGDLLPNIINGKFYEDKYNQISWLQPTVSGSLLTGRKVKNSKGILEDAKIGFHFSKVTGNKFKDTFYESMTQLYYLSPVTWAKTLVTGEGFAYLAKVAERKFTKEVGSMVQGISGFNMDNFLKDITSGNSSSAIGNLTSLTATQIKKFEKFAKKYERLTKSAHNFGALARVRDKVKDLLEEKVFKAVRLKVGRALLKIGFVKQFSKHAVMTWMKGGGMFTLLKGITTAAMQAIGFTVAGPIGNAIVTVVSTILSDVILKAAKPILKFGVEVAILVIIGGLGLIILLFGSFYVMVFGQHSHVAPQEIIQCDAFVGTFPIIDDPDNPGGLNPQGPMEPFVAGALDSGEQCLLGSGSFSCTQGPYGSFSHSKVAAIDIGGTNYFHAPSFCGNGGTCKITYVGDVNCAAGYAGGLVKFTAEYQGQTYEFKLIHVDSPLAAGQTITSGQRVARTMEWHETGSKCSSGKHLHLETKHNGATVNPYDVLTNLPSQGGFGCSLSACR